MNVYTEPFFDDIDRKKNMSVFMKTNEKLSSLRCIKISKCSNFFSNQDKRNLVCINTENKLIIIMQFKPSEYLNSVRSSRGN